MKKVKMVQILFILICLVGYKLTSAQSEYVVTAKGDTIRGKVKYLNYGVEKKVQVTPQDGKKSVYSILQTSAFCMDDQLYIPVRNAQGYTYMKLLKKGYLSLFAFQLPNQTLWDGRYLLKRDGSGMEVPNIGFKKILVRYLEDCPEIKSGIEEGQFSKTTIDAIVDQYNACIDKNTNKTMTTADLSTDQIEKLNTWNELETSVRNTAAFDGKIDALEMITEIKSKISKAEKIPNFLIEGLKETLKDQSSLKEALDKALLEIQN